MKIRLVVVEQPLKALFVPEEFAIQGKTLQINGVGGYKVVEVAEAPKRNYDFLPTVYDDKGYHNTGSLDTGNLCGTGKVFEDS